MADVETNGAATEMPLLEKHRDQLLATWRDLDGKLHALIASGGVLVGLLFALARSSYPPLEASQEVLLATSLVATVLSLLVASLGVRARHLPTPFGTLAKTVQMVYREPFPPDDAAISRLETTRLQVLRASNGAMERQIDSKWRHLGVAQVCMGFAILVLALLVLWVVAG